MEIFIWIELKGYGDPVAPSTDGLPSEAPVVVPVLC